MSNEKALLLAMFKSACRDVKFWQAEKNLHPDSEYAKEKFDYFSGLSLGYYNAYEVMFGEAPVIPTKTS